MAFYEREFIEISRSNARMEIVGLMKCTVEQEDVRKYILARVAKEKRAMFIGGLLAVLLWVLAAIPVVGELFLTSSPDPHLGGGTLVLTVVFALFAIVATVVFLCSLPASKRIIASADPDAPDQLQAAAPDAVVWKQSRQWELCHAHDLVPLESALQGHPVFLGSQRPTDATARALRQNEEKKLVEYAAALTESRDRATVPGPDLLLIYLDIDRLDSSVYGFAAGQALARVLSAEDMEGVAISSGDSAATLAGSANEYVIGLSGDASRLDRIEAMLCSDTALEKLLSPAGICRGGSGEPLVADGVVRNGELIHPAGQSTSFCAAGLNEVWKKSTR